MKDFLEIVATDLIKRMGNDLSHTIVVFPNFSMAGPKINRPLCAKGYLESGIGLLTTLTLTRTLTLTPTVNLTRTLILTRTQNRALTLKLTLTITLTHTLHRTEPVPEPIP